MTDAREQKKITVYTAGWCPYCVRAKSLLTAKGWSFEEVDVDGDEDKRAWLREATGRRTVPQVRIGDEWVGGFDDLSALDRAGKLAPKVLGP